MRFIMLVCRVLIIKFYTQFATDSFRINNSIILRLKVLCKDCNLENKALQEFNGAGI